MISDYFNNATTKGVKPKEDKAIEIIAQRIKEVKDYISNYLDNFRDAPWIVEGNPEYTRFYVNHNVFERMKSDWTQKTRIKIEDYDWKALLYYMAKELGYTCNYANGTMGVCLELPPCMK
jgi:hypothetical protein